MNSEAEASLRFYSLKVTDVEHLFEYESSATDKVGGILTILAIMLVNLPLIIYIYNHGCKTFMNKLIAIDCIICSSNIIPVFNISIWRDRRFSKTCFIPFGFIINLLNRLLALAIVFYRYVFVLKSHWVETRTQRKIFCILVSLAVVIIWGSLTAANIAYRDQFYHYLGNSSDKIISDE